MTIHELIDNFSNHLKQYGLNGDPYQQELYKWEIISKYHDKLDTDSPDFAKNISEMNFRNLWYATNQRGAIQGFAKYEPEEYRSLLKHLFDESLPLQMRVTAFTEGCNQLWDTKIKQLISGKETSASCDERLISCFLACKYPEKYPFYKNDVYLNLCELFGVESKKAGQKLVHFYDLLNENVIPLVKTNVELCEAVNAEVDQHGFIESLPLIAQTVIWNAMQQGLFSKKQIWLFLGGKDVNDYHFDEMYNDGVMALCGWDKVGDLSDYPDKESIDKRRQSVSDYQYNTGNLTGMLHAIANEMKEGDIVLAKYSKSDVVGMGTVTGDYRYDESSVYGKHCRNISWTHKGVWHCASILKEFGQNVFPAKALTNVTKAKYIPQIIKMIEGENKQGSTMPKQKYKEYIELLQETHNLVLTGAPGTGKTYMAQAIADEMGAETQFVQFHPSYDYTDFVEGLRPIDKDGQIGFERKDGVFKEFCKMAVEAMPEELDFSTAYDRLIEGIRNGAINSIPLKSGKDSAQLSVSSDSNIKWASPTEEGNISSNCVSKDRMKILYDKYNTKDQVTNLTSKDIKDVIGGCDSTYFWAVLNYVVEEISSAANRPEKQFVFIIDEINRGEASKIFGELFFAIDPGYRGKYDKKGKERKLPQTQYQNLVPKTDVFAKGFYVPKNVYILATMNDIDRSVESMDFAMRRRFTWKEVTPFDTADMLNDLPCAAEAKATMERLNSAISETDGLGAAYMVGPSYFLKLEDNGGDFGKLWTMNIEPLLKEYLRGFRKTKEILEKFKTAYFGTKVDETDNTDLLDEED